MWKGLKHYMEDFSMLDKREVPEITLWDKYLVYATAFGIADKVLKQLKTVYPNLESMTSGNTYTCMNLMINTNFTSSFSFFFFFVFFFVLELAEVSLAAAEAAGGRRRWRWKIIHL